MSTSIDDLLKGQGRTGASMDDVDAILEELNNSSAKIQQQPPPPSQPQQIAPPPPPPPPIQQPNPMIMQQLQQQQHQLEQLSQMNREKDILLTNMSKESKNITKNSNENVDLLTEFKPSLIIFVILIVLNLPILNNLVSKTIGIENDNTIFAILKTFVICIIFFLINKFI